MRKTGKCECPKVEWIWHFLVVEGESKCAECGTVIVYG